MMTPRKGQIVLDGLCKRYGELTVVDQVSTTIEAGQFYSLLGPSGSGKTSTLMMLAGFSIPDSGSIRLDGVDITHLAPQDRGLGMVFQNYALFPHLTIFENIAFPLRVRKLAAAELKERVEWALEAVRLGGFAKRFPRELSGGQQQRVALARAIVFHPQVVLMDEPLGALDKNLRYQMQVEIKDIQEKLRMTVVYVTHDQEEAMNMSDQIAIMNHGKIEQVGPPRDVYEQPQSIFVGKFLGEANLLHGLMQGAGPDPSVSVPQGTALLLRPERIVLCAPDAATGADMGSLAGTVRRVSFLGHLVRYTVSIHAGPDLTVDAHNTGDTHVFQAGDLVLVRWANRDARVLQDV